MERLPDALQNLRTTLQSGSLKKGGGHLLEDVLKGYNGIVNLTGHGGLFECNQEDDDNDPGDNDDEKGNSTNDNDSHGLHNTSDSSKDSESVSDSERTDESNGSVESVGLDDLDTYIKTLNEKGVTSGGMGGKDIKNVLDRTITPSLRNQDHKKLFYSFKSKKDEIDRTIVQEWK